MIAAKASHLIGVATTFLILTWTFTGLRVYVRIIISKRWGWDDTLLLVALFAFTAEASCYLSAIPYGLGQHLSDIPVENFSRSLLIWWICDILYLVTTLLLRFSISLFILRICAKCVHKIIIYSTLAVVLTLSILCLFLSILRCSPPSYFWTQFGPNAKGSCLNMRTIIPDASYAYAAISAAADWILGVLPVWLIWDLKMNSRTKISIGILLSFGMIAGVAALTRIPFIYELTQSDENDFFWYNIDVAIWYTVEPGLGITATAACVLRPLMKKFYGLSSYKTNRPYDANCRPPTWPINDKSYRTNNGRIELDAMDGVATSVLLGSHGVDRAREWTMISPVISRGTAGNESEEELTRETNGILILRTVEIRSQERKSGERGRVTASMDSKS